MRIWPRRSRRGRILPKTSATHICFDDWYLLPSPRYPWGSSQLLHAPQRRNPSSRPQQYWDAHWNSAKFHGEWVSLYSLQWIRLWLERLIKFTWVWTGRGISVMQTWQKSCQTFKAQLSVQFWAVFLVQFIRLQTHLEHCKESINLNIPMHLIN